MKNWALVFGLLGASHVSICQDAPVPDPEAFESFFHQVSELTHRASGIMTVGTANGIGRFLQPTPQEVIGLTDREAQLLNGIALDFENKMHLYDESVGPMTLEARLRLVESANVPENRPRAEQDLDDLKNRRDQVTLAHVDALRQAFGEVRFKVLVSFIQSKNGQTVSFFPAVAAKN
jgi:hypothetical protein